MDELYRIAIRAAFAYFVLLGIVRASGKRTVWEGTAFDFVLVLILGDMFDDVLWGEVPASQFAVAVGTLALLHTTISILSFRSRAVRRVVEGDPSLVVRDGAYDRRAMRDDRLAPAELAMLLRHRGVAAVDLPDVRAGHLEFDGQLSVLKHEGAREAHRSDLR